MADRQKYIDDVSGRIDNWDKQIIAMENEADGAYRKDAAQLKERTEELRARLDKLKNSGDDAWDILNREFQEGFDEMAKFFSGEDEKSS